MSYKIAVATSNGRAIDLSFGAAASFDIYEADENGYRFLEKREFCVPENDELPLTEDSGTTEDAGHGTNYTQTGNCGAGGSYGIDSGNSCGNGSGCGGGGQRGNGCANSGDLHPKVALIADCRCVVCKKIGFHIQKQLEKRAIISFDIDCAVDEALEKITAYLERVDSHQSLRGFAQS